MRRRLALLCLAVLAILVAPGSSASTVPSGWGLHGGDISWPNCPTGMGTADRPTLGLPMPVSTARFVVMGVTNGPAFTHNPCLSSQVSWVRERHLWAGAYAVLSYPTPHQLSRYGGRGTGTQRLHRVGTAEAQDNIRTMRLAGLRPPMVWVDVEPVRSAPWSNNPTFNNAVINGAVAAYRAAGLKVGFYSYAYGWKQITGGRQLPTYPTWVPSGSDTRASALARCSQRSFSGGKVAMGQWTVADRDHDVTCPLVTGGRWPGMFAAT